jgi:hypothetical protein
MSSTPDALAQLDHCKGMFDKDAAQRTETLLRQFRHTHFQSASDLLHLHETLLFLRAYPQSEPVLRLCDDLLYSYARRLRGLPKEEMAEFEYAEVSGVAGTGLTTNFSHAFATSLTERHLAHLHIDWDQYEHTDRLAIVLAQLIPGAREDWAVGRHASWRKWLESAAAEKHGSLRWLLNRVKPEVYDLLEIPLRFDLRDTDASRSRARIPRRTIFYHKGSLLARRDVSFAREFAAPAIRVKKLAKPQARKILGTIIDASAVRYRELYGFEYPDESRVFHADLGRGMDFYFFGVPRRWRLRSREYCAGMYFKNGVPMGYVEVMWTKGVMEVGFNLYYTFRQGETAWLYARLLKLFHEQYGVHAFTIDPYQLGHENEEAIESGAFWFYAKLGFRSQSKHVRHLAEQEQARMSADAAYRTPPRILRKLAECHMEYRVTKPKPPA